MIIPYQVVKPYGLKKYSVASFIHEFDSFYKIVNEKNYVFQFFIFIIFIFTTDEKEKDSS